MSLKGWIGVDFDATLAHYEQWTAPEHCGVPVAAMVERVKGWLADGREVRIFTARVYPIVHLIKAELTDHQVVEGIIVLMDTLPDDVERLRQAGLAVTAIRRWCLEHLGKVLAVTCVKDTYMSELYDDRAVQVEANTGVLIGKSTRGSS